MLHKEDLKNVMQKIKNWFKEDISSNLKLNRGVTSAFVAGAIALTALVGSNISFNERESDLVDEETTSSTTVQDNAELEDVALYLDDDINRSGNALDLAEDVKSRSMEVPTTTKESTTTTTTVEETTTTETPKETTKATTKATTSARKTVTAAAGDGWWHLGQKAGVDYRYLAAFNGLTWQDPVYTGKTYKVPTQAEMKEITLPKVTQATTQAKKSNSGSSNSGSSTKATRAPQNNSAAVYSLSDFMFRGVITWQGKTFTYYSQQVLPGYNLRIPGRHVNSAGYVADGNGYIVLASDYYPKGTVISTPFGSPGKVYDAFGTGQPASRFDVYIR